MQNAIGLITANYSTKEPSVLTESRPIASLPFLGRYRLVDFALSNMINAGITTVGLVMPYNYRSLTDHVGAGKDWGLSRKKGGLFNLPGSAFGTSLTGSRFLVRDLVHNKIFFERSHEDYVILSSCNFVYNMDYRNLISAHASSGADITVLTQTAKGKDEDVIGFDVEGNRVKELKHGVVFGDTAFLDCFVIGRKALLQMLEWYEATDYLDIFEALSSDYERVNVQSFNYEGYIVPVFNTRAYFKANMDLLRPEVSDELFPVERPIRTKAHDNAPAKFESGSHVTNAHISGSCRIYGSVADSILGRSVVVESGAAVRNSIVMQSCIIKSGAHVENAIVDRNNIVPAGTELRGTPDALFIKGKARE